MGGIDTASQWRDRHGRFEPQIVRWRLLRLTGVDEIVLSLYANGHVADQPPVGARARA
jgi:hypothetical protein